MREPGAGIDCSGDSTVTAWLTGPCDMASKNVNLWFVLKVPTLSCRQAKHPLVLFGGLRAILAAQVTLQ